MSDSDPSRSSHPRLDRRRFLAASAGAAGALSGIPAGRRILAGPFADQNEYLEAVPTDKRLDARWLRSLRERGEKETVSDPRALRHVGMPVGGLFAGTVYLGGDGRLWLWDVFNRDQEGIRPRTVEYRGQRVPTRNGANYIEPAEPSSPFRQGFSIRVGEDVRTLDAGGFSEVTFEGRYPIGRVDYRDPGCPVEVRLEAFSPFVPLKADDSSLPVTVMSFRVRNRSDRPVRFELVGHLENPVCLETGPGRAGRRVNRVVLEDGLAAVVCSAAPVALPDRTERPDIVFEDFERPDYGEWVAEGEAFGDGPVAMTDVPDYQGDVGGRGKRVVNSHATAPGGDVTDKDRRVGTLTSPEFRVERRFIHLLVGGGAHAETTCVDLLVDGEKVASVTGRNDNRMRMATFPVAKHAGRTARLRIVDEGRSGWGNIGVDHIVFSDRPASGEDLVEARDFGTMAMALVGEEAGGSTRAVAARGYSGVTTRASGGLDASVVGQVSREEELAPGEETTVDFAVAWHFPNFRARGVGGRPVGHHYAARFASALEVARHVSREFDRLAGTTRRWVETWYDSSLPYWLLDRTMANTSTLATTTCYRFADGRFWAWEGVGCCQGTCTHVWHYAQAPGRLFPEIERVTRSRVDFGLALHEDGGVGHRAHLSGSSHPADDGQCGRILGALREHQMSPDGKFLRDLWPRVRRAVEYMIRRDGDADGILGGAQPNTLDASWYGKISFTSSLYLAALRAGEQMAREMGDEEFAGRCRTIAERGARSIRELFNGEYFVQLEDPEHTDAIGVGDGCYIDQIFGQTWAHWTGLGRLFDREEQVSALRALWKHNFVPDVGTFRDRFPRGRWYAMEGDAGLLMCTWPRGGQNPAAKKHWQYGYFNECMSGFEWQAAAHMVWEGLEHDDLLEKGLAVSRAIHDRYRASLRNPYNEVECSDHYARAMASFGVFQAVCGLEVHGPRGYLAVSPRLSPDDFRAAFTAAGGWGSVRQRRAERDQTLAIEVRHGRVRLRELACDLPAGRVARQVSVRLDGSVREADVRQEGRRVTVALREDAMLEAPSTLELTLS